jgi:hypothetical protein
MVPVYAPAEHLDLHRTTRRLCLQLVVATRQVGREPLLERAPVATVSVRAVADVGNAVDSLAMLLKAKTWLVKVMPFLARWGSNTTPNP